MVLVKNRAGSIASGGSGRGEPALHRIEPGPHDTSTPLVEELARPGRRDVGSTDAALLLEEVGLPWPAGCPVASASVAHRHGRPMSRRRGSRGAATSVVLELRPREWTSPPPSPAKACSSYAFPGHVIRGCAAPTDPAEDPKKVTRSRSVRTRAAAALGGGQAARPTQPSLRSHVAPPFPSRNPPSHRADGSPAPRPRGRRHRPLRGRGRLAGPVDRRHRRDRDRQPQRGRRDHPLRRGRVRGHRPERPVRPRHRPRVRPRGSRFRRRALEHDRQRGGRRAGAVPRRPALRLRRSGQRRRGVRREQQHRAHRSGVRIRPWQRLPSDARVVLDEQHDEAGSDQRAHDAGGHRSRRRRRARRGLRVDGLASERRARVRRPARARRGGRQRAVHRRRRQPPDQRGEHDRRRRSGQRRPPGDHRDRRQRCPPDRVRARWHLQVALAGDRAGAVGCARTGRSRPGRRPRDRHRSAGARQPGQPAVDGSGGQGAARSGRSRSSPTSTTTGPRRSWRATPCTRRPAWSSDRRTFRTASRPLPISMPTRSRRSCWSRRARSTSSTPTCRSCGAPRSRAADAAVPRRSPTTTTTACRRSAWPERAPTPSGIPTVSCCGANPPRIRPPT